MVMFLDISQNRLNLKYDGKWNFMFCADKNTL